MASTPPQCVEQDCINKPFKEGRCRNHHDQFLSSRPTYVGNLMQVESLTEEQLIELATRELTKEDKKQGPLKVSELERYILDYGMMNKPAELPVHVDVIYNHYKDWGGREHTKLSFIQHFQKFFRKKIMKAGYHFMVDNDQFLDYIYTGKALLIKNYRITYAPKKET